MHLEDPDQHLTPEQTAAHLDGVLAGREREAVEAHLAACAECRAEVVALSPVVRAGDRRKNALRAGLVAATAVAASLVLLVRPGPVEHPAAPIHRDPPPISAESLETLAPSGPISPPLTLSWKPVDTTARYRVSVFDPEGSIVYRTETADSTVILPDSLSLAEGAPYFWKVEAATGWDQWISSRLVEFSVKRAGQGTRR